MNDYLNNQKNYCNAALLTHTLFVNCQNILQRKKFSIRHLIDLENFVNAIILHPKIGLIQGRTPEEFKPEEILNILEKNKILYYYKPSYNDKELISMINQYSLFRDLSWWPFSWDHPAFDLKKKEVFESESLLDAGVIKGNLYPIKIERIINSSTIEEITESDLNDFITKLKLKNDRISDDIKLFDIIHLMGTGQSYSLREYLFRTIVYLCSSDYDKLTFYPDYLRIPYIISSNKRIYSNLSRKIYERIAEIFNVSTEEILNDIPGVQMIIPPFLHDLLNRVLKGAKFFDALFDIRDEFSKMREKLNKIELELRKANTIFEKKKIFKYKKDILTTAIKKYNNTRSIKIKEFLSFALDITTAVAKPQDPSSYNESLLTKPLEWLKEWWLKRPICHLLNVVDSIEKLPFDFNLVEKTLGYQITSEEIVEYKKARYSVYNLIK